MKFNNKILKKAISTLVKNTRGAEVYLRTHGNMVVATASSSQIAGIVKIEAKEVSASEKFGLNAKFLGEILTSIDAEEISLNESEGLVEIKAGRSRWSLRALSTEPMPYKKVSEPRLAMTLSAERYKALMERVTPFLSSQESRPSLTGMTICAQGNTMMLYGATPHCVSKQEITLSTNVAKEVTAVISRDGVTLTTDNDVLWRLGENVLEIITGDFAYQVRLITAPPPDFDKVTAIPEGMRTLTLVKAAFSDAVERVGLCARVVESSSLQLTLNEDHVRLYAKSDMIGDAEEIVPLLTKSGISGEEFGMNSRYLESAVKASRSVKLKIGYTAPLNPVHITDDVDGDDKWRVVIAPVRLPNQE